jgi:hypothetical protein
MSRLSIRHAAIGAVVVLAAVACGSGSSNKTAAPSRPRASAPSQTPTSAAAMPLPPGAENMKVAITSPADGTKVTDNAVTVRVSTSGYDDTCDLAGKPVLNATSGHYHVLIDKSLVNMYCTPEATVSMQNVKPGTHKLTVVPTLNDHAEVEENAQSITIDYEPTNPLPAITDATETGTPSIKILSPKPGDVVSGAFDVTVQITSFHPDCDLMGKPGVVGYGHWHLNADSSTGPMQGMGTMFGMSCANVFHATTTGFKSGETHSLIALLTDNSHAPLSPPIEDKVDVKIG